MISALESRLRRIGDDHDTQLANRVKENSHLQYHLDIANQKVVTVTKELRDIEVKTAAQALIRDAQTRKEKNKPNEEMRLQDEIDLLNHECKLHKK